MNREMARANLEYEQLSILLGEQIVILGRSQESSISFRDTEISRIHALIIPNGNRFLLLDYKSANGSRVNGRYVTWAYLQDGDKIGLGTEELIFRSDDNSEMGSSETMLRELRSGRYDILLELDPRELPPSLRKLENPRLLEVLELHRMGLDLSECFDVKKILERSFSAAQELFQAQRALVLLKSADQSWTLAFSKDWKDEAQRDAAGRLLANLLFAAKKSGWPSLEALGMKTLLGNQESTERGSPKPRFRAMGLPMLWRGQLQGLYYIEGKSELDLDSSFFTTFVDFLFTLSAPLRRALIVEEREDWKI